MHRRQFLATSIAFTTSLCSPTRAALITGRNHHSVGFGTISETSTGYPGYDSVIPLDRVTIGEILKANGYATSWFGKDHNTPAFQTSQAGPVDQWPIGMGFEYFYGFVSARPINGSPISTATRRGFILGAPSKRTTQYFEMFGNRALYHDGWIASTVPYRTPWDASAPRPSIVAGRDVFTYTSPIVGIPQGTAPSILNMSFTITADIEVPADGCEGMLVTEGGRFGGWAFYLLKGKPVFVYNLLDLGRPRVESAEALSPGKHTVKFDFTYEGPGFGRTFIISARNSRFHRCRRRIATAAIMHKGTRMNSAIRMPIARP
jgi:hypothetical protein